MNVSQVITEYMDWLKSEISSEQIGEYHEITLPFLDRFNDYIQIYIKQDANGKITLTDDGYIITNLINSGYNIKNSIKRKEEVQKIIKLFGIKLEENDIIAEATRKNFPQKKHSLIQAMLQIDDLYQLQPDKIKSLFAEDIEKFFTEKNFRFLPDIAVVGNTGSYHKYDFVFPKSERKPERFCRILNSEREDSRNIIIFNWIDTKETRPNNSELIVILNSQKCQEEDLKAFEAYEITPVLDTKLKDNSDLFAA